MSIFDLTTKIQRLSAEKQEEVADFVDFLLNKTAHKPKMRAFGSFKGKITMATDFDNPLEDFKEYQ